METYAKALFYAIPFFLILIIIEIMYGVIIKRHTHNPLDTISSLSSGLTNIVKDSLGLALVIISYPFLVDYIAVFNIKSTWLVYVIAFIVLDFAGFLNHWLSHKINIFWNQHVIHHSSEEFNLACALRQSISNVIGYFAILLIPAALLGVPEEVIAIVAPVQFFLQFWYHTRYIGKLGWAEYIFVTPSQHRVHHAINPEYIDKNMGQIFCIWDRMFGTFQEEMDHVPPVYGVLKPAATWNPILINFQHIWQLIKDAWRTKNWGDKIRIWFMPTDWRPKDVREKYPISIIEDVYNLKKYETPASTAFIFYCSFQVLVTVALMMFMFYNYSTIGFNNLLLYGAIVFVGIYGYTTLMDGKKYAVFIELIRSLAGIAVIFYTGDWFGVNLYLSIGSTVITAYFLFTIIASIYFAFIENKNPEINIQPAEL
ncbi:sterol desaturase family protein [Abyssalbus ytuae]|uniref:Sterol desaturase family protein n=1 Tax=Abyssalbus ytuae TaxID=2926907 RepID=A0A9E7CZZ6_9FLAO|nr:sterol desaturase family protein [Abyssalbus ytuae]UOB18010.1 sterol desaturase family protein [Abyssalbus ytuae]